MSTKSEIPTLALHPSLWAWGDWQHGPCWQGPWVQGKGLGRGTVCPHPGIPHLSAQTPQWAPSPSPGFSGKRRAPSLDLAPDTPQGMPLPLPVPAPLAVPAGSSLLLPVPRAPRLVFLPPSAVVWSPLDSALGTTEAQVERAAGRALRQRLELGALETPQETPHRSFCSTHQGPGPRRR